MADASEKPIIQQILSVPKRGRGLSLVVVSRPGSDLRAPSAAPKRARSAQRDSLQSAVSRMNSSVMSDGRPERKPLKRPPMKIVTYKLDFVKKAKPKVQSFENINYQPGGGNTKIDPKSIDWAADAAVGEEFTPADADDNSRKWRRGSGDFSEKFDRDGNTIGDRSRERDGASRGRGRHLNLNDSDDERDRRNSMRKSADNDDGGDRGGNNRYKQGNFRRDSSDSTVIGGRNGSNNRRRGDRDGSLYDRGDSEMTGTDDDQTQKKFRNYGNRSKNSRSDDDRNDRARNRDRNAMESDDDRRNDGKGNRGNARGRSNDRNGLDDYRRGSYRDGRSGDRNDRDDYRRGGYRDGRRGSRDGSDDYSDRDRRASYRDDRARGNAGRSKNNGYDDYADGRSSRGSGDRRNRNQSTRNLDSDRNGRNRANRQDSERNGRDQFDSSNRDKNAAQNGKAFYMDDKDGNQVKVTVVGDDESGNINRFGGNKNVGGNNGKNSSSKNKNVWQIQTQSQDKNGQRSTRGESGVRAEANENSSEANGGDDRKFSKFNGENEYDVDNRGVGQSLDNIRGKLNSVDLNRFDYDGNGIDFQGNRDAGRSTDGTKNRGMLYDGHAVENRGSPNSDATLLSSSQRLAKSQAAAAAAQGFGYQTNGLIGNVQEGGWAGTATRDGAETSLNDAARLLQSRQIGRTTAAGSTTIDFDDNIEPKIEIVERIDFAKGQQQKVKFKFEKRKHTKLPRVALLRDASDKSKPQWNILPRANRIQMKRDKVAIMYSTMHDQSVLERQIYEHNLQSLPPYRTTGVNTSRMTTNRDAQQVTNRATSLNNPDLLYLNLPTKGFNGQLFLPPIAQTTYPNAVAQPITDRQQAEVESRVSFVDGRSKKQEMQQQAPTYAMLGRNRRMLMDVLDDESAQDASPTKAEDANRTKLRDENRQPVADADAAAHSDKRNRRSESESLNQRRNRRASPSNTRNSNQVVIERHVIVKESSKTHRSLYSNRRSHSLDESTISEAYIVRDKNVETDSALSTARVNKGQNTSAKKQYSVATDTAGLSSNTVEKQTQPPMPMPKQSSASDSASINESVKHESKRSDLVLDQQTKSVPAVRPMLIPPIINIEAASTASPHSTDSQTITAESTIAMEDHGQNASDQNAKPKPPVAIADAEGKANATAESNQRELTSQSIESKQREVQKSETAASLGKVGQKKQQQATNSNAAKDNEPAPSTVTESQMSEKAAKQATSEIQSEPTRQPSLQMNVEIDSKQMQNVGETVATTKDVSGASQASVPQKQASSLSHATSVSSKPSQKSVDTLLDRLSRLKNSTSNSSQGRNSPVRQADTGSSGGNGFLPSQAAYALQQMYDTAVLQAESEKRRLETMQMLINYNSAPTTSVYAAMIYPAPPDHFQNTVSASNNVATSQYSQVPHPPLFDRPVAASTTDEGDGMSVAASVKNSSVASSNQSDMRRKKGFADLHAKRKMLEQQPKQRRDSVVYLYK